MRKYNADLLKIMALFETVTRTRLKDSFIDNNELLTFVVDQPYIGKAIGKNAVNIKKLEKLLKRKIKIVGYSQDPAQFVKNLIYPVSAEVLKQDKDIIIKSTDIKTKAYLIGRNQSNINNYTEITKKYFKIEKIKVV